MGSSSLEEEVEDEGKQQSSGALILLIFIWDELLEGTPEAEIQLVH